MAAPVAVAPVRRSRSQAGAANLPVLAWIEGRRLLLRPAVMVGAALSLLAMVKTSWTSAPVLNRDDTAVTGALLVLAAATLLATNAATLRGRRHAADELLNSMPTPARVRTLAHLSSVVAVVPLAVLVAGGFWWWRISGDPVTSPDPFELLTGPALVALGGFVGVALARWAPSRTIAPVVVVGLFVTEFILNVMMGGVEYGGRAKWLAPMVGQQDVARELLVRPTGWHLTYVMALVALLGCAALLRDHRDWQTLTIAGMALTVVVGTGGIQVRPLGSGQQPHELAERLTAAAQQNCQRHGAVTYCAVPGYESWIDDWRASVEPVLARLPRDARPEQLTVIQDYTGVSWKDLGPPDSGDDPRTPTTWEVRPAMWWGHGSGEAPYQFGLALGVAALAVGLSPDGALSPPNGLRACSSAGQGRAVVALWLAGQLTDDSARYLRHEADIRTRDTSSVSGDVPADFFFHRRASQPVGSLSFGVREAAAAAHLLDRSPSEVAPLVGKDWDVLTDPGTTTDQAVQRLGLQGVAGWQPTVPTVTFNDANQSGDSSWDYFFPCP